MSGQTIHSASNIGGVLDNIIDLFKSDCYVECSL